MAGMDVLLKQFGLTPEKIEEMARPVVTAILDKVSEFDANEERRHMEVMARFDKLEALHGTTEPAGEGMATLPDGDYTLEELDEALRNPKPILLSDELGGGSI